MKNKQLIAIILIIAMLLSILGAAIPLVVSAADYSTVRVKLSNANDGTINVGIKGNYIIEDGGRTIKNDIIFHVNGNNLSISDKSSGQTIFSGSKVKLIRSSSDALFSMFTTQHGKRNYLGDLEVRAQNGDFLVINHVPIEQYLYGVVAYEMNNSWPTETLKAQAVAARSYVVKKMQKNEPNYDLGDTSSDQVYKGLGSDVANVINAVDSTGGQVLMHNGVVADCYYTASNGGQTELTQNIWSKATPYCVMKDDPYDIRNPESLMQKILLPYNVNAATPLDSKAEALIKVKLADQLMQSGHSTYLDQIKIIGFPSVEATNPKYGGQSRNYQTIRATVDIDAVKGAGISNDGGQQGARPQEPYFEMLRDSNGQPVYSSSGPLYIDRNGSIFEYSYVQAALDAYYAQLAQWESGGSSGENSGQGMVGQIDRLRLEIEFKVLEMKTGSSEYRAFTNPSIIMYYTEQASEGTYLVNARYGHGVGMSQRGAQQMGKEAMQYSQILSFYYEGTNLSNLYTPSSSGQGLPDPSQYTSNENNNNNNNNNNQDEEGGLIEEDSSGSQSQSDYLTGHISGNPKIYKKASSSSGSLGKMSSGAVVYILAQEGEFYQVATKKGSVGYVPANSINPSAAIRNQQANIIKDATLTLDTSRTNTAGVCQVGDSVTILQRDGNLYYITTAHGYTGYVPIEAVKLIVANPYIPLNPDNNYGQVTKSIKMYSDNKLKKSITSISSGTVIQIKAKANSGKAYKVVYKGKTGYVSSSAVKLLKKGSRHPDPAQIIGTKAAPSINKALSLSVNTGQIDIGLTKMAANSAISIEAGSIKRDLTYEASNVDGNVNASTVNVRKNANTTSTILKQLVKGESIKILGQTSGFYMVKTSDGTVGYVAKDYITADSQRIGVAKGSGVNVRADADTTSKRLETIEKNDTVTVLGSRGAFYKVRTQDGVEGYIADYLLAVKDASIPEISTTDGEESNNQSDGSSSEGATPAKSAAIASGKVNSDGSNVRMSADESSESIFKLNEGTKVYIYVKSGDFYKISYDGIYGYISKSLIKDLLQITEEEKSESSPPSSSGVSTNGAVASGVISGDDNINVRQNANTDAEIIGQIANGEKIYIFAQTVDFYKISYGSDYGYVAKQLVKNVQSVKGSSSGSSSSTTSSIGVVNASSLNVRSLSGTRLSNLKKNDAAEIIGTEGTKYKIKANGIVGYVESKYISKKSLSTGRISASALNVRKEKNLTSSIVTKIPGNGKVYIIVTEGEWLKIFYNGYSGYVQSQYITQ